MSTIISITHYPGAPFADRGAIKQQYSVPFPERGPFFVTKTPESKSVLQGRGLERIPNQEAETSLALPGTTTQTNSSKIDSSSALLTMSLSEPMSMNPRSLTTSDASLAIAVNETKVSSAQPSKAILDKAADLIIYDANGQEVPFKNLYWADPERRRRVMIIFIRHFFCGNCQEYVRTLTAHFPPTSLPADTSIALVGCGSHTLIPSYVELTSCPYPIYADPTKRVFTLLGMQRSLSLGWKDPEYIHHTLAAGMVKSIVQGVRRIGAGDVTKAGGLSQNGGEFLFEVEGADFNIKKLDPVLKTKGNAGLSRVEVTFCHRMRNTRDHTEIPQLGRVLDMSEGEKRSRSRVAGLERRWTSGNGLGNLARSFSNRRQSWLERRNSSSWSGTRRRDRSDSGARDAIGRRSPDRIIETVREDIMSQYGENAAGVVGEFDLVASPAGQEVSAGDGRFSFEGGQAAAA